MAKTPPGRTDGASGRLPAQGGHQGLGFRIGNKGIYYIMSSIFPYFHTAPQKVLGLGDFRAGCEASGFVACGFGSGSGSREIGSEFTELLCFCSFYWP